MFLRRADGLRNQAQVVLGRRGGNQRIDDSVSIRIIRFHVLHDLGKLVRRYGVYKPKVVHVPAVDPHLRVRVEGGRGRGRDRGFLRRRDGGKRRFEGFVVRLIFRGDFQLYHEQRKYVERKRANFVCAKLA